MASKVEFCLIGRVFPGDGISRFASLDGPLSTTNLARDDFSKLLGRLHFVFLPVIATSVPIVSDIFAQFGDIGYLCSSAEDMQRALHGVLTQMDSVRYKGQVEAMRRARETRLPIALARHLRCIFHAHFRELVPMASRR
jgi:hypothetical protein